MAKFKDAQKRKRINREGLVYIFTKMFKMKCDELTVTEIIDRIKTFGQCQCGCKQPFKGYCEFDHVKPRAIAREGDATEWQALTKACHRRKTTHDVTYIAKTKSMARKNGVLRESDPMPEKRGNAKIQSRGFRKPEGYKHQWAKRGWR